MRMCLVSYENGSSGDSYDITTIIVMAMETGMLHSVSRQPVAEQVLRMCLFSYDNGSAGDSFDMIAPIIMAMERAIFFSLP